MTLSTQFSTGSMVLYRVVTGVERLLGLWAVRHGEQAGEGSDEGHSRPPQRSSVDMLK